MKKVYQILEVICGLIFAIFFILLLSDKEDCSSALSAFMIEIGVLAGFGLSGLGTAFFGYKAEHCNK